MAGIAIVAGGVANTAIDVSADRPAPIGAHRHYKFAANGDKVYVGPNFCDVDASAQGFYGFHQKVHVTDPGLNDILSEGC
jgi:hypothetical protein